MNLKITDFILVIQARMSSSRLPGKVLKETGYKNFTLLSFLLQRIYILTREGIEICVATSNDPSDDKIAHYVNKYFKNIKVFRGELHDVLTRYYECVKIINKRAVIRITGDCPFSDPKLIKDMANDFIVSDIDYLANTMPPEKSEFSDGFDVEIFSFDVLESCALDKSLTPLEREHVTFAMWKNGKYRTKIYRNTHNNSRQFKLSIDNESDFEMFIKVIKEIDINNSYFEIENIIEKNEFNLINKESVKNSGWKK